MLMSSHYCEVGFSGGFEVLEHLQSGPRPCCGRRFVNDLGEKFV